MSNGRIVFAGLSEFLYEKPEEKTVNWKSSRNSALVYL